MPPENAPRRVVLGAAAIAAVAAALALPGHPGSASPGPLEARRLPVPAPTGPVQDSVSFSLVAQHEAAAREDSVARVLHLEHVRHEDHLVHLSHLRWLRSTRLEASSQRHSYSGRHRSPSPGSRPAPEPPVLTVASGGESPQAYAESVVGSGEYGCLYDLWMRESGWRYDAENPGSGAYGIPQSLPASKMAAAGPDWRTNPITQVKWGLGYIDATYGTPCGAWSHEESQGWY